jgi:opacity protein-like surface antigen
VSWAGLASTAVFADNPLDVYVGGSVGEAHLRTGDTSSPFSPYIVPFDARNTGWKAFVGVRPISQLAIEVSYTDFGKAFGPGPPDLIVSYYDATSKQNAISAFAIGYLPLPVPFLDLYAKLGLADLHTDRQVTWAPYDCPAGEPSICSPHTFSDNRWNTDLTYGAGVQAKFGPFAVRAEYERINAHGGNPDLLSIGASWTF